jgi:hypothetical protein
MHSISSYKSPGLIIILFISSFFSGLLCTAQPVDTLKGRNLYRPTQMELQDTVGVLMPDTLEIQRIRDSIELRLQFVRDSILAREQFIRDSILRRQRILDSVTFLRDELYPMLEAYYRATRDEIILRCHEIPIVGDSCLGDFTFTTMPFGARDPYAPWRVKASLAGKSIRIVRDDRTKKIVSIHTSQLKSSFMHTAGGNLLVIQQPAVIQKNWAGHFYKNAVDSVFYDRFKRIARIRSYVLFHAVINGNQRGNLLFTNRTFVKQFEYDGEDSISGIQIVRFCERWKAYEENKVCSILKYGLTRQGNTYILTRRNDPANTYSDGTFTFIFDEQENLNSVSFINLAKTENWQRIVEINKDGYVSCYMDKANNVMIQSLCMKYHPELGAKHPVEMITTTFEKDGISYLQTNNTTGKVRTRDKMTLEWTPWH